MWVATLHPGWRFADPGLRIVQPLQGCLGGWLVTRGGAPLTPGYELGNPFRVVHWRMACHLEWRSADPGLRIVQSLRGLTLRHHGRRMQKFPERE